MVNQSKVADPRFWARWETAGAIPLEFVPDRGAGASLGLEYAFRSLDLQGRFVIFNYHTGQIVERVPDQGVYWRSQDFAMARLYEINNVSRIPTQEILNEIDATE